jgi:hypothetical protein
LATSLPRISVMSPSRSPARLHCPLATQPRPARSSSGPLIDRHWSRHSVRLPKLLLGARCRP